MNIRIRTGIVISLLLCVFLLFSGCTGQDEQNQDPEATSGTISAAVTTENRITQLPPEPGSASEDGTDDLSSENVSAEPVQVRILQIYTMNALSLEPEAVSVLIPQDTELTPEFIVDTVIDTLEDQGYTIEVESVETQEDAVIVNFYKDQPPSSGFGSSAESAVLDVFAQSLVDNLEDYSKVIYRLEGEAYSSGHYEFGPDQVYLERAN